MVIGNTPEERKKANNRICPCKPALEEEIPQMGHCHCGIFCTKEYAHNQTEEKSAEEAAHLHSRGLTKEEAEVLLNKEQIDSDELEALLDARELKLIDFKLIDVREPMEYNMAHIEGVDELLPTSQFYEWIEKIQNRKDEHIILYCYTGSRSFQVQDILKAQGFKHVGNLTYGIISYKGKITN